MNKPHFSYEEYQKNRKLCEWGFPKSLFINKRYEVNNMVKLSEAADNYEDAMVRNITELDLVPIDIEINEEEFKRKDPKEGEEPTFKILTFELNGTKYRMPKDVLRQLKVIRQKKPDMKEFSVGKTGSGLNTEYTVVPM